MIALVLSYAFYLGPHRAAAAHDQQRSDVCEVADVVVATPRYPPLEQFLRVQWGYLRGSTGRVHDVGLAGALRSLPATPDPAAMTPVADYCHSHGLGILLRSG